MAIALLDDTTNIKYVGMVIWDYTNNKDYMAPTRMFTAWIGNPTTVQNMANHVPHM